MNQLINWIGKADQTEITYDAGLLDNGQRLLLTGSFFDTSSFPAINYPQSDSMRDVVDITWEKSARKADRTDYLIAVACGSISGLIDIFYVGDFSLERANEWGTEQINGFVKKVARLNGFKGDDLSDAIGFMERKFGLAADSVADKFGGGLQHHLRDFSHHFSLGGLIFSLFTQFTGKVIGTDVSGAIKIIELTEKTFIGGNFEEKILFGTVNWFFHMVSDMAGSSFNPGAGTGIPGPVLSLLKEISAIPLFRDHKINEIEFHRWVSKLFNGTLLAKRDKNGNIIEYVRFNLRTEIGILHEVGRQFVPVIINECLVRGIYFLRRLFLSIKNTEIHSIRDFKKINASELLPFNNRVIRRMITVASGTFTAIDIADAGIRAIMKNGGIHSKTLVDFAVRINIAGVGRFVIACKADGELLTEDIRKAKIQRNKTVKAYEKQLSDLHCLTLDYQQTRILYSLERILVRDDIASSEGEKEAQKLKTDWEVEWEKQILSMLPLTEDARGNFFLTEDAVMDHYRNEKGEPWQYLIIIEAMLFKPYYPLIEGEEGAEKNRKKLKYRSRYLENNFPKKQNLISKKDVRGLMSSYKQVSARLTGSVRNIAIGAIGTGAVVVVTGGLAFAFAPAIATALVGSSGLYGAALTSYSLAAIGGGSLAAGGLGMAGGTAIITGGGALLGMIGGTGVSAITTLGLLSDSSYILIECCKLLVFSRDIFIERYRDYRSVESIHVEIKQKIDIVKKDIAKCHKDAYKDKRSDRKAINLKMAEKSEKYLKRCESILGALLESGKIIKD